MGKRAVISATKEETVKAFILKKMFEEEPKLTLSAKGGISFFSFN